LHSSTALNAVTLARQPREKRDSVGASIDQQCLNAGLVDEIMIHLAPVLIGNGIRLFDNLQIGDTELERTELVATAELTSLRFRVIK
jgi:riboflavin biosynthesis pyrimidine reductase